MSGFSSRLAALVIFAAGVTGTANTAGAKTFKELFPSSNFQNEKAQKFVESLDYKQGNVPLQQGGIVLKVPQGFYFLAQGDARRLLIDVWGNPPTVGTGILGMILPADKTPVDDTWGAVVTFDEDGYVSDEEANKINYSELLTSMKDSTSQASEERVKAGFGAIKLIGWASTPYYDQAAHKLHWAKELEFGGNANHTLNYDVRALGRRGVLKINFVADLNQLDAIKSVIPAVMSMPEFEAGSRYQDYIPGTDKVAAYGIGGLIAGKLLAKAGMLAVALAFLKKGWIIVLLAGGGLVRIAGGLFSRGRKTPPTS